jgi:hypothetical protein
MLNDEELDVLASVTLRSVSAMSFNLGQVPKDQRVTNNGGPCSKLSA